MCIWSSTCAPVEEFQFRCCCRFLLTVFASIIRLYSPGVEHWSFKCRISWSRCWYIVRYLSLTHAKLFGNRSTVHTFECKTTARQSTEPLVHVFKRNLKRRCCNFFKGMPKLEAQSMLRKELLLFLIRPSRYSWMSYIWSILLRLTCRALMRTLTTKLQFVLSPPPAPFPPTPDPLPPTSTFHIWRGRMSRASNYKSLFPIPRCFRIWLNEMSPSNYFLCKNSDVFIKHRNMYKGNSGRARSRLAWNVSSLLVPQPKPVEGREDDWHFSPRLRLATSPPPPVISAPALRERETSPGYDQSGSSTSFPGSPRREMKDPWNEVAGLILKGPKSCEVRIPEKRPLLSAPGSQQKQAVLYDTGF